MQSSATYDRCDACNGDGTTCSLQKGSDYGTYERGGSKTKILLFLRTCLKTSCNLDLINIHLKRQPSMYSDPSQRSKMKLFLKNSQLLPYCFSGQIF